MLLQSDLLAIVGHIGDNEDNLSQLVKQLETTVGLIPFVGAGLSIPFGFPAWGSFLIAQAKKVGIEQEIQQRIDAGQYEEAAEDLLNKRKHRAFHDAILNTFGIRKLAGRELRGAVSSLPHLAVGPVITTNFDYVLEEVFNQAGRSFSHKVWGADADLATEALNKNLPFLLKIHGDALSSRDRVLTKSDYEKQYGSTDGSNIDYSLPVPKLLQLMLLNRPLLFLGCSLNKDRTVSVLRSIAHNNRSIVHYAIVEYPESDIQSYERSSFLSDHNIRPIWYPHGRHDLIVSLLKKLEGIVAFPTHKSEEVLLSYKDHCVVSLESVKAILELNEFSNVRINWHDKIQASLNRLEDWRNNYAERVSMFRWATDYDNPETLDHLTEFRAQIEKNYEDTKLVHQLLQRNFIKLLNITSKAERSYRESSIKSYAGFASLRLIQRLKSFENRLFNSQIAPVYGLPAWLEYHRVGERYLDPDEVLIFRDIKNIPSYLVDTYIPRSSLARLALSHIREVEFDEFMICRIFIDKYDRYERIVLPKNRARLLDTDAEFKKRGKDIKTYYELILPQWLVHDLDKLPSENSWRVYVVEDGSGLDYRWS